MKKTLALLLCVAVMLCFCSCGNNANNNSSDTNKKFSQTMTIVTMTYPAKCKTFTDTTTINQVLNVLGGIEKEKLITEDRNGGIKYTINLNVDGTELNYAVGGIFTDIDGKQYEISNGKEIREKLKQIYNEIDVAEAYYP